MAQVTDYELSSGSRFTHSCSEDQAVLRLQHEFRAASEHQRLPDLPGPAARCRSSTAKRWAGREDRARLNCAVHEHSIFARKNTLSRFAQGYQISHRIAVFDQGFLDIELDGQTSGSITRAHMKRTPQNLHGMGTDWSST